MLFINFMFATIFLTGILGYTYNHVVNELKQRYVDEMKMIETNNNSSITNGRNTDWEIIIHDST